MSEVEEHDERFYVVDRAGKEYCFDKDVDAVNFVKRLYPNEVFQFLGIDGEEGEAPGAGTTIIDLPWTPPQKPKKRRR